MAEIKDFSFLERLNLAQTELKAPKGQFNSFGKYKYRSAEDILEAIKPINLKYRLHLQIADEIQIVGDRVYVKAVCALSDVEGKSEPIVVTAFAREPLSKKGMDESQITGTASSYARKYALNGLYLIDDTKDADSNEHRDQQQNAPKQAPPKKISATQVKTLNKVIKSIAELVGQTPEQAAGILLNASKVGVSSLGDLNESQYGKFLNYLNNMRTSYEEKANGNQQPEQTSLMDGNTTRAKGSD